MSPTRLTWWLAIAPLLAACAPQEIVVADVAEIREAGPDGPPPCSKNDDCDSDHYCERPCGDPTGTCVDRPHACGTIEDPKCGCSGTTYWNDCFRKHAGDSKRSDFDCSDAFAAHCKGHLSGCPIAGSSCGLLLPGGDPCAPPPAPKCWIIPSSCEGIAPSQHWEQCGNPGCVDTCNAIQSGIPSYESMHCH